MGSSSATGDRGGAGLVIAIALSLLAHAVVVAVATWRPGAGPPSGGATDFGVDIEIAPEAPKAEALPPEQTVAANDVVNAPEPPPPPVPSGEDNAAVALDAGAPSPDAAPPRPHRHPHPHPSDAGPSDAGVADAGTAVATATPGDAGATTEKSTTVASAGTTANLLAYFPSGHVVTVLIRFDRLRGTEWAQATQDVLAILPDYETLVADPKLAIADKLDLIAVSTPRPTDPRVTTIAMKTSMTPSELRDFLDEPGAPVAWSRVSGGVLGTRGQGKRVVPRDHRVFLAPGGAWMVLAQPRDLAGMLDPASGDLDTAAADPAREPAWLARLPDLEAESGIPDGPALMMTLAPRDKTWNVPDVGLGFTEIPAPERMTLSLEIDKHGFVIRGNLRFDSVEHAQQFVDLAEGAQQTALDAVVMKALLKRASALNAVQGLSLQRTDQRVAYSTSISIADARTLIATGTLLFDGYMKDLEQGQ